MEDPGVHTIASWPVLLEQRCYALIETGDLLLNRFPVSRRTIHSSAAGYFYRSLQKLQLVKIALPEDQQPRFAQLEAALEERMLLFMRRRVFPCPLLRRLRRQQKALEQLIASIPPEQPLWGKTDVLVGTLRNPAQLNVCLNHSFYHVPVSQIPKTRLPIGYVAIYQSRSLFPHDCGIRFYGRVRSCKVVPRWQIEEIPKSSNELYYRLDIVKWEVLDVPIQVREIPFNHLFTNLFLLLHSRETPELELNSPEQYRCYQALRLGTQWNKGLVFQNDQGKIRLKRGRFYVYPRKGKPRSFPKQLFRCTPATAFHQIYPLIASETGQKYIPGGRIYK